MGLRMFLLQLPTSIWLLLIIDCLILLNLWSTTFKPSMFQARPLNFAAKCATNLLQTVALPQRSLKPITLAYNKPAAALPTTNHFAFQQQRFCTLAHFKPTPTTIHFSPHRNFASAPRPRGTLNPTKRAAAPTQPHVNQHAPNQQYFQQDNLASAHPQNTFYQQESTFEYSKIPGQTAHSEHHVSTYQYPPPPQSGVPLNQIYHTESHTYSPALPPQQQQQLKWYQQSFQQPRPPNEFFLKHPILYQIFQTVLFAIGVVCASSFIRML